MEIEKDLIRKCHICGKPLIKGWYICGDEEEYYCSEQCLHQEVSPEELEELFDTDGGYWTDWSGQEMWFEFDEKSSGLTILVLGQALFHGTVEWGDEFSFTYEDKEYTCAFNDDDTIDLMHGNNILDNLEKR